jgi:hypothetical protein
MATPSQFTDKIKWIGWVPTFKNFLRSIPGHNGVPLIYVIRDDSQVINATYEDFLDEYIDKAPLEGAAFITEEERKKKGRREEEMTFLTSCYHQSVLQMKSIVAQIVGLWHKFSFSTILPHFLICIQIEDRGTVTLLHFLKCIYI